MSRAFAVSSAGIREAIAYIEEKVAANGDAPMVSHRLAVIIDEMVSNMIRHDPSLSASDSFELTLMREGERLMMVLADPGAPFDPLAWSGDARLPASGLPGVSAGGQSGMGGHGIAVIRGLAREVSYRRHNGRNQLTVFAERDG